MPTSPVTTQAIYCRYLVKFMLLFRKLSMSLFQQSCRNTFIWSFSSFLVMVDKIKSVNVSDEREFIVLHQDAKRNVLFKVSEKPFKSMIYVTSNSLQK